MLAGLYVVATPIGNLADLSERARSVLAGADLIAAEDTRHSRKLLEHYGINTRMLSVHEHNEASRIPGLLADLQAGRRIALISDAGTPAISDPGMRLVAAAAAAGITVTPIPGPSAVTAAVSASGMGDGRFWFEGFLPSRAGARTTRLQQLSGQQGLLVFYVAPHRLAADLAAAADVLGTERDGLLARELSKLHEQFYRGTLGDLVQQVASDPMISKGELVLLVAGKEEARVSANDLRATGEVLLEYLSARDAARALAQLAGCPRNEAYDVIQALADSAS